MNNVAFLADTARALRSNFKLVGVLALVTGCGGSHESVVHHAGGNTGNGAGAPNGSTVSGGGSDAIGAAGGAGPAAQAGSPTVLSACGLPSAGASGVPKPSGAPGNLTVIPWAGFKGAVSYTFDDANSSQIKNYAALNGLGVHLTFYLQTNKTEAGDPIWAQAVTDGHELGNHTQSHQQTGTAADVDAATQFIKTKFGVTPWTMAAPYGDASYVALAKDRFLLNRGVSPALVKPNDGSDPFNTPCYIPAEAATAAGEMNGQVDSAQSQGGWRIVLVHGFSGGSDGAYKPVAIAEFTAHVAYAKALGNLWIDSMVNVGSYWRGQKAFPKTSTTAGADQTWSWTLPANFPPGKCLRVTVDGGTLKQGDQVLPWDDHGYYEIALDAGSLTLSP